MARASGLGGLALALLVGVVGMGSTGSARPVVGPRLRPRRAPDHPDHGTHADLVRLVTRWQPVDAPDLPVPVLLGDSHYEGQLRNYTTDGGFVEIGPFQVEGAGTGGHCANPHQNWAGARTCRYPPPGNPAHVEHSNWGEGCRALGLDPSRDIRSDTALVRVGLWSLHRRGLRLARGPHRDLFPARGTRWWSGAVLCSFGPGAGWTDVALRATHALLHPLPEAARWAAFGAWLAANRLTYRNRTGLHTWTEAFNRAAYHSVDRKLVWARDQLGWRA